MTSFPQRKISDMESTLEEAGKINAIDYILIPTTNFHTFSVIPPRENFLINRLC